MRTNAARTWLPCRREYGDQGLDVPDLASDPMTMFRRWLDDTVESGLHEPNAMVVTSVSGEGQPSARMVLLKAVDERGFVFYTNYESRKGGRSTANPAVALLFPWHDLQRQVRVEGTATRVSQIESEAYFSSRPRGSQLGAWASPQSARGLLTRRARRPLPSSGGPVRRPGRAYRSHPSGAATSSAPRWSSSGRAATAGCTTAWSTAARGDLDHHPPRPVGGPDPRRLSLSKPGASYGGPDPRRLSLSKPGAAYDEVDPAG